MSSFQASLLNPSTGLPDLTPNFITAVIVGNDDSNYTTNTDAGHAEADFSLYRKVYFSLPNGFSFIFSSLGDGNAPIDAPASAIETFTYTLTQGDGIYTVSLLVIPTFINFTTYLLNDMVYYNSSIYQSLKAGNTAAPTGATDAFWELITEQQAQTNSKYFDTQVVGYNGYMQQCQDALTLASFCTVDECCGTCDLCRNQNLLNSVQMNCLIDAWNVYSANNDFNNMQCIIDKACELCTPIYPCYPCGNCP